MDINEQICWRRYYFSLPVETLFRALLDRKVPRLPLDPRFTDYVSDLYDLLDEAQVRRYPAEYAEHLGWKYTVRIKEPKERRREKFQVGRRGKSIPVDRYYLFIYPNDNIVARIFDPHEIGGIKLYWRYAFYPHPGEFLLASTKQGINLFDNPLLLDLADDYMYDFWLMGKYINKNK